MAPTKAELLAYLRQARAEYPLLTKEELEALALAHFAGGLSEVKPTPEKTVPQAESAPRTAVVSDQLIEERITIADSNPPSVITAALTQETPQHNAEIVWPVLSRRVVFVTLIIAMAFSAVIAGSYFYGLRTPPPKGKVIASVTDLSETAPYETGEVTQFGKRFAGNASYYDDKYHSKVLEMVGMVEVVERNSEGYLEATLLLVDQRNTVFRARFRFLPEQEEAIALARGTMAVLKGNYARYKDGMIRLFPAVVVYNSAQPEG
ncbi:MAG: hypothetical protein K0Q77_2449 [Anaerosporomusa subterranea]|jgi:hypothetical protein|nr:hypothetical protein [Anaerosporomusa subterranea]